MMREKDITMRLKDLSQQAQEWEFPQAVDQGDWLYDFKYEGVVLVDRVSCHIGAVGAGDDYTAVYDDASEYFLILEFRHCLAWFKKEGWEVRSILKGVHPQEGQFCITVRDAAAQTYEKENSRYDFGPSIDEAAAALVNRLLAEKK